MESRFDRITINPEVMSGQPGIRGMRSTGTGVLQAAAVYRGRAALRRDDSESEGVDTRQALLRAQAR